MGSRKIITICGSFRFRDEMMKVYNKLTEFGHLVWLPWMPDDNSVCSTPGNIEAFYTHREKIRRSNIVVVISLDNYIGVDTQKEIDYADSIGIPVFYYKSVNDDDLLQFM